MRPSWPLIYAVSGSVVLLEASLKGIDRPVSWGCQIFLFALKQVEKNQAGFGRRLLPGRWEPKVDPLLGSSQGSPCYGPTILI